MSGDRASPAESRAALVADLAARPLLVDRDGTVRLRLGDGAIPRLVAYTHEDKAAKGLRKLAPGALPQPPIHFSVIDMLQDTPVLLLAGEAGSGKTTLARDIAMRFSGARIGRAFASLPPADDPVDRNESGDAMPQVWSGKVPLPLLCRGASGGTLGDMLAGAGIAAAPMAGGTAEEADPVLLIIDDLDRAGAGGARVLAEALALRQSRPGLRVLALADEAAAFDWMLPPGVVRLGLLPLLATQRRRFVRRHSAVLGEPVETAFAPVAGNAALFALALQVNVAAATPEALVDAWLDGRGADAADLAKAACDSLRAPDRIAASVTALPSRVRQLLAAVALRDRPIDDAVSAFAASPDRFAPVMASLLSHIAARGGPVEPLALALARGQGDAGLRGAVMAAGAVAPGSSAWPSIEATLLRLVETGALTPRLREQAGRILSRHGDPRDLEALAPVPGGSFAMGATTHPNSAPPHAVTVAPFRIGIYPVTNGLYGRFVEATGRPWHSPARGRDDRRSAPATDLTWRDARACCDWLTGVWQAQGRIAADEHVRLATEPEWERAARGDRSDGGEAVVYPWPGGWNPDAANCEDLGLNDTCTVGLFPAGRSPYGCLDMAGQVWEWTTTLWGEDMARPDFPYPYRADGREDASAGPAVRRVLRGGCFSSGAAKACCTYRGSLEPDGFWRGNGFRVVVSRHGPGAG